MERDRSVDYGTLWQRTAALAFAFLAAGMGVGDPVAILLERGIDAAAAFFATLSVGAIAVVMNETLRPRQIEHVLAHAGARHLVTTAGLLARQPRPLRRDARILDVTTIPQASDLTLDPIHRDEGDVAQVIYTSGSTGLPKGVAVSHGNLWAATGAVTSYLGITSSDRIASLLPFSFVYGMSQLLCSTRAGAALVVERSPLTQQIVATVRAKEVSVLPAVPSLWMRLLQVPGFRTSLPRLRVMTSAGGHLPVGAVRTLRQAQPGAELFLMYGQTEVMRSTYLPPDEVDRRPDSIGRAIPGAEVAVLRADGTPAAPGEIGELVHRGPTVTLGYWKDPDLTAQVFRQLGTDRAVYTGDLVRRDADGFLYFVSRKDHIIKTMGYRVGPDEIGDVLHASGEVAEAAVVGERDVVWGQRIVAYVVLADGGSLERLRAYCGRELPRHLQPARIEVRDALPVLPNGKPDLAAVCETTVATERQDAD
jgi:amino acid adenylation domain-containing protein